MPALTPAVDTATIVAALGEPHRYAVMVATDAGIVHLGPFVKAHTAQATYDAVAEMAAKLEDEVTVEMVPSYYFGAAKPTAKQTLGALVPDFETKLATFETKAKDEAAEKAATEAKAKADAAAEAPQEGQEQAEKGTDAPAPTQDAPAPSEAPSEAEKDEKLPEVKLPAKKSAAKSKPAAK